MGYAEELEGELSGLDLLPPELRKEAENEKHSHGGYRFDSQEQRARIKAQRGAVWDWLRGLGGNLIKHGVNLTRIPMPVELNEPRSFLQRMTDGWAYGELLHAAAAARDPAERLKLVVAFAVGGLYQQVSCDKPFNPILGETLQGSYPCGCQVFAEQISHHPPISCWQVVDQAGQFEFTGSTSWSATFAGNSVKGTQTGMSAIRFSSDGAMVTWNPAITHVRGVLFGDRVVKFSGNLVFTDDKNNLRCEVAVDPQQPKKGLVKRFINKAKHPRRKHHHDEVVGDLLWVSPEGGTTQWLDRCYGTWLTEICWEKGVRSSIVPQAQPAAPSPRSLTPDLLQQHQQRDQQQPPAALACHSIGSFSSSLSSDSSSGGSGDEPAGTAAAAAAAGAQTGASAGEGDLEIGDDVENDVGASSSSSSTAVASSPGVALQGGDAGSGEPEETAAAAGVPAVASSATMSSYSSAHRTGHGIGVTKKLWDAKHSRAAPLLRLPDDHPGLLKSDCRFRQDIRALAQGQQDGAQKWKLTLEQQQRHDAALREQGRKHMRLPPVDAAPAGNGTQR